MFHPRLAGIVPRLNASVPVSLLLIYVLCLSPIFLLVYFGHKSRRAAARKPKGCRKLGLYDFSNLKDEDNYRADGRPKRSKQSDAGKGRIRVKALLAYPIKSCAGVEFNIADFESTGMAYDRQFCFAEYVNSPASGTAESEGKKHDDKPAGKWVFRTLRDLKYGKLALVRPEIWVPDPSSPTYSPKRPEVRSKGVLVINYPRVPGGTRLKCLLLSFGMRLGLCSREESFQVPLSPPASAIKAGTYPSRSVRIWKDTPMAIDYGKHIPPSLLAFIGPSRPMTLFRIDPDHHRKVFRGAPSKEVLGFQATTGFADSFPVHMLGLGSVREIDARTKYAIPNLSIRRFRPNIILEGSAAFEEDDWKRVRFIPRNDKQMLGSQVAEEAGKREGQNGTLADDSQSRSSKNGDEGVEMYISCRTMRCRLPNVDPNTGLRHPVEPDKTLKSFRCIDAGDPNNACLGMQCVPAVEEFTLRVGDELKVLEKGEHFYLKMG
ncbi:MOSC domain-containing protein [Blastomyces dermatitidis ATCC 18188]|uniref:MOSC domain-containing protein n=1 Tax=Ajellomyces dermatitidis (strain ATCC 18188 / CBS 674.68) TaxID=653446 RepID=F2TH75_AJEDA|nr:MOSC domain-containing protein [Blastomyces dermatitidis ATCC 18188]